MYQVPNINADAEVTCTVEGYPLNNVRWYFSQRDFNIQTEIKTDQHHKVETIASPDSIKSVLVIRNVNEEHFGDYSIKVEGGQQQIVEKMITLEPMMNWDGYSNLARSSLSFYTFKLFIAILVSLTSILISSLL
jgi:hypothetical protein